MYCNIRTGLLDVAKHCTKLLSRQQKSGFLTNKQLNVGSIGADNSACGIDGNAGVRGATRNIVSQIRVAGITASPLLC